MSMVSDMPHPNPAQDRVGNAFLNVCKRQPRQPPEGLQAVLAHAIRHNTLQHDAQAAPSAWCLHLRIVLVSHLPGVCVFRSFACSAHMPLVTRTRLGPGCMLGRSLPLGSTLVFQLVLGTFLTLFRSACFNHGPGM